MKRDHSSRFILKDFNPVLASLNIQSKLLPLCSKQKNIDYEQLVPQIND